MRKLLEQYAYAWNIHIKEQIPAMSTIILLRNSHPAYREMFAREAMNAGEIDREQAKEFIRIV
jgi:hypothetical protein